MCFDPSDLFGTPDLPDPEPLPEVNEDVLGDRVDEVARRRAARDRARVTRNDLIVNPATRPASGTGLSLGTE